MCRESRNLEGYDKWEYDENYDENSSRWEYDENYDENSSRMHAGYDKWEYDENYDENSRWEYDENSSRMHAGYNKWEYDKNYDENSFRMHADWYPHTPRTPDWYPHTTTSPVTPPRGEKRTLSQTLIKVEENDRKRQRISSRPVSLPNNLLATRHQLHQTPPVTRIVESGLHGKPSRSHLLPSWPRQVPRHVPNHYPIPFSLHNGQPRGSRYGRQRRKAQFSQPAPSQKPPRVKRAESSIPYFINPDHPEIHKIELRVPKDPYELIQFYDLLRQDFEEGTIDLNGKTFPITSTDNKAVSHVVLFTENSRAVLKIQRENLYIPCYKALFEGKMCWFEFFPRRRDHGLDFTPLEERLC